MAACTATGKAICIASGKAIYLAAGAAIRLNSTDLLTLMEISKHMQPMTEIDTTDKSEAGPSAGPNSEPDTKPDTEPNTVHQPDEKGHSSHIDPEEVARFAAIASEWWDARGKFRPLHLLAPTRIRFIRDQLSAHFDREVNSGRPLDGLKLLDIGCGGGLVSEPLARLGGQVTGIDPAGASLDAARAHAVGQGLEINYRDAWAEDLVKEGAQFDAVLCLEVIEHVPDVSAFVKTCRSLVAPGGIMVLSTINRTAKSYAMAIIGAEYVLRWLPTGTHTWSRFVTPGEMANDVAAAGLKLENVQGVVMDPLSGNWSLSERDVDVNYMATAREE